MAMILIIAFFPDLLGMRCFYTKMVNKKCRHLQFSADSEYSDSFSDMIIIRIRWQSKDILVNCIHYFNVRLSYVSQKSP